MELATANLTLKQNRFCLEYVRLGGNGQGPNAYRLAYDTDNMGDSAVRSEAWKLLQNPLIAKRILDLEQAYLETASLSPEAVIADLSEDRRLAYKHGQASSAVAVTKLKGQHIGMWPNKTELQVTGTVTHQLSEASVDELRTMLEDVRRQKQALSDTNGPVIEGEAREIDSGP